MKKVNKKTDKALSELVSRQDYLVVQANDLSKAFGKLSLSEHKLLDFTTSFVTKDSTAEEVYTCNILDVIHHFGWPSNGTYYKRVANLFKSLKEKDNLYLYVKDELGEGIVMASLFNWIDLRNSGLIRFKFSELATPYLIDLRANYYSFKLSQLAQIKSKYSLVMLKLWEANRMGNNSYAVISGSLDEWETWFLGSDRHWPAGRFMRDCLNVAIDEIGEKIGASFVIDKQVRGRKVEGYEITINSKNNSQYLNDPQK